MCVPGRSPTALQSTWAASEQNAQRHDLSCFYESCDNEMLEMSSIRMAKEGRRRVNERKEIFSKCESV